MKILKLRRTKISAILTTVDPELPISLDVQRKSVESWLGKVSKVLVIGPVEPAPPSNGLRYLKTGAKPTINNLLATYMQSIPGSDICVLTTPNIELADPSKLLEEVDARKMEMAWACHINVDGKPTAFIMSSPVIAHLMNDLPQFTTFHHEWQNLVHNWMLRLLRHRYFDGTDFGVFKGVKREETPFVSMAELGQIIQQAQKPEPKRAAVKKVKLAGTHQI